MKIFRFRDVVPEIPRLLFRRSLRFRFELLPQEARNLSGRKIMNFFVAGLNQFFKPARPFGHPVVAQVEPSNYCNLACPLCVTTSQSNARPRALLSLETFKSFIDEVGDYLLIIVLWNWGEPFLNPDLCRMIAYAKKKGIVVHCSTNGNVPMDDAKADELVASGLDSLVFGIDGATEKTYRQYRKGGDLSRVIGNMEKIIQARKRQGVTTPRLVLRFVVMSHNEHEIELARALAKRIGVDYFSLKNVDLPSSCGEDLDSKYVPVANKYRRYKYGEKAGDRKRQPFVCPRPWKRITLDALGHIIFCEMDYQNLHPFGCMNEGESAMSAWKGDTAASFRREFHDGHNRFAPCVTCTYKNSTTDGCIIDCERMRPPRGA